MLLFYDTLQSSSGDPNLINLISLIFQLTASSVGSSAATQTTWPPRRPLVACRRRCPQMWITVSPCGPTPSVPGGRPAVAGATSCTTPRCSASRSSSPNTTAPATGPPPRPKPPARPSPPSRSAATTRAVPWGRAPAASRRNTPTVDYSGTLTCGRSGMSFRPARWRGRGL